MKVLAAAAQECCLLSASKTLRVPFDKQENIVALHWELAANNQLQQVCRVKEKILALDNLVLAERKKSKNSASTSASKALHSSGNRKNEIKKLAMERAKNSSVFASKSIEISFLKCVVRERVERMLGEIAHSINPIAKMQSVDSPANKSALRS